MIFLMSCVLHETTNTYTFLKKEILHELQPFRLWKWTGDIIS